MAIEVTHTEFAKADPKSVWQIWSDLTTWSKWDHGIEWCRFKEGNQFQLHGEALLLPKGAPAPLTIRLIECTPLQSFTDEGVFDLGSIQFSHRVIPHKKGVKITHTLKYVPANSETKKIFETRMLPKLQKELPESVKTLAKLAEEKTQAPQLVKRIA